MKNNTTRKTKFLFTVNPELLRKIKDEANRLNISTSAYMSMIFSIELAKGGKLNAK